MDTLLLMKRNSLHVASDSEPAELQEIILTVKFHPFIQCLQSGYYGASKKNLAKKKKKKEKLYIYIYTSFTTRVKTHFDFNKHLVVLNFKLKQQQQQLPTYQHWQGKPIDPRELTHLSLMTWL